MNNRNWQLSPKMKHYLGGHGKPRLEGWPPQNREQRRLVQQEERRQAKRRQRK